MKEINRQTRTKGFFTLALMIVFTNLFSIPTYAYTNYGEGNYGVGEYGIGDTTKPTGGSITYLNNYQSTTSVSIVVNDGNDSGSGINISSRLIQRKSAVLNNGICQTYTAFTTIIVTGTYPNLTDSSVISGNCYQYSYLISDNSGNQATYSSSNIVKIDTSKPTTPGTPISPIITNSSSQAWSWTAASDSISGITQYLWRVTGTSIESGITSINSVITNLSEGIYSFFVKAVNGAGIESDESLAGTLIVDRTPPSTPGIPTTSSPTTTTTPTWTWQSSIDNGSGLTPAPYIIQWCTNTSYIGCDANITTSSTTSYKNTSLLSNGTWYIRVRSKDLANNQSNWSLNGTVLIDNLPPTIPTVSTTTYFTNKVTPTLTWGISNDNNGVGLASPGYVIQWCTTTAFSKCPGNTAYSNLNKYTVTTALTPTKWYFRVKAKDALNNISSYSLVGNVWIDTKIPTGSVIINMGATNTSSPKVTLTIYAHDDISTATSIRMIVSQSKTFTGATYETYKSKRAFTFTQTRGVKTIYIRFKDQAGNLSKIYYDTINY